MELSFEYIGPRPGPGGPVRHWSVKLGEAPVALLKYDAYRLAWVLEPVLAALESHRFQWAGKSHGSRIRHVPAWLQREAAGHMGAFALECLISEDGDRRRAREAT